VKFWVNVLAQQVLIRLGFVVFFLTIATNVYCKLQAYVVLGQFLVLKKNQELFQEWMKDTCQANSKQSADCWQCLKDWCEEFL
jgi:hypothetical protein